MRHRTPLLRRISFIIPPLHVVVTPAFVTAPCDLSRPSFASRAIIKSIAVLPAFQTESGTLGRGWEAPRSCALWLEARAMFFFLFGGEMRLKFTPQ